MATYNMATYMYTSATGSNWDDDDEDFNPNVYESIAAELQAANALANARLALQQLESAVESAVEVQSELPQSTAAQSQVDYSIEPDEAPTYADHMTQYWSSDHHRRPAYIPLSCEYGFVYPDQRRKYSANWKATKLQMGSNMNNTMMMIPSPLRLSKTWTSDSMGAFIEDRGYIGVSLPSLRVPTPRLSHENESEEERDEVYTPPSTPSMVQAGDCQGGVAEYDSTTGAVDLSTHKIEAMEPKMARELVDSGDVAEVYWAAEQDQLDDNSDDDALVYTKTTRSTRVLPVTTAEAIFAVSSIAKEATQVAVPVYDQLDRSEDNASALPVDSNFLTNTPTLAARNPSSGRKYVHDPTNTPLVWDTVAAGWFALSCLPWYRIVIAAAGAFVDVAAFAAHF